MVISFWLYQMDDDDDDGAMMILLACYFWVNVKWRICKVYIVLCRRNVCALHAVHVSFAKSARLLFSIPGFLLCYNRNKTKTKGVMRKAQGEEWLVYVSCWKIIEWLFLKRWTNKGITQKCAIKSFNVKDIFKINIRISYVQDSHIFVRITNRVVRVRYLRRFF